MMVMGASAAARVWAQLDSEFRAGNIMKRRLVFIVVLVVLTATWFAVRNDELRRLRLAVVTMLAEARQLEMAGGETRVLSFMLGSEFEGPAPQRVEVRAERRGERLTLTLLTGPDALRGGELVFRVATVGGEPSLTCAGSTINARYLPSECR